MTFSATQLAEKRQVTWTRDKIITALRRYAELFGDDFTSASFNPSLGKWRDRPELIERYVAGDPETGTPWPSVNSIKHTFGSFNEARIAAGFEPNKTGPKPGSKNRAAGEHAPDLGTRHVTRVLVREKTSEDTLHKMEVRLERALRRAERLEADLERSRASKRAMPPAQRTKTKILRVSDDAAVARARLRAEAVEAKAAARLDEARAIADAAKRDVKEARSTATKATARAERAEATVTTARADRAAAVAEAKKSDERANAAAALLDAARAETDALRAREQVVVVKDAPEAAVLDAAREAVADARRQATDAARRAAHAEREYMELAAAAKGEERKLTKGEINELRASGPAGPALLGAALKELASVRKAGGNKTSMFHALTKIASAAVSWRERL